MLHVISVSAFMTLMLGSILTLVAMLRSASPAILSALNVRPAPVLAPQPLPPRVRLVVVTQRVTMRQAMREAA